MIVKYKYIGIPIKELGSQIHRIEVHEDSNVEKLIRKISNENKTDINYLKNCNYMINNKRADLKTKLKDGDYVLIMKALGGG
ncbi:MAG: MoaD/ThiS family protein [Bacillota bacterium]|nr:MoaD/ThiS family protein [Bacillota bacterium]